MDFFLKMLNIQAILLIYILCGMLCRKLKIITVNNQQQFINFVLTILMPCMVFNSFKNISPEVLKNAIIALVISLVICLFSMMLGKLLYRQFSEDKKNILSYATLINNAGFAGLPLAADIFGSEGLIYASIFLIPIRIFMWSYGITLLSDTKSSRKQVIKTLIRNPNVIAVVLGMMRGLLQIEFPEFIEGALSNLSSCVSPVAMIIIGAIIADVSIKCIFEKDVLFYASVRLIFLPGLVFVMTRFLGFNETVIGTSMILTAMPAATTTALLASRYDSNVEFASKIVFASTILSLITVPLLMLLL